MTTEHKPTPKTLYTLGGDTLVMRQGTLASGETWVDMIATSYRVYQENPWNAAPAWDPETSYKQWMRTFESWERNMKWDNTANGKLSLFYTTIDEVLFAIRQASLDTVAIDRTFGRWHTFYMPQTSPTVVHPSLFYNRNSVFLAEGVDLYVRDHQYVIVDQS